MNKLVSISAFAVALVCVLSDSIFEIDVARLRATSETGVIAFIGVIVAIKLGGLILGLISGHQGYKEVSKNPLLFLFIVSFIVVSVPYSVVMTVISQEAHEGNNTQQQTGIQKMIASLDQEADALRRSIDVCIKYDMPSKCDDDKALLKDVNEKRSELIMRSKHTATQSFDDVSEKVGIDKSYLTLTLYAALSFLASVLPFVMSAIASHYWSLGKSRGLVRGTGPGHTNQTDTEVQKAIKKEKKELGVGRLSAEQIVQACKKHNGRGISKDRARKFVEKKS